MPTKRISSCSTACLENRSMAELLCPECGNTMQGTVEQVGGIALARPMLQDGKVEPDYEGYTEIDWNSQVTLTKDGESLWMCELGHYVKANELVEDPT